MRFLSLGRGCVSTRADCPNGFVSKHEAIHLVSGEAGRRSLPGRGPGAIRSAAMTVSRTPAVGPETRFRRPAGSDATEPPEAHGVARDAVKLLVVRPGGVSHARFADLGDFLRPGDLLVVNNSATLPRRKACAS